MQQSQSSQSAGGSGEYPFILRTLVGLANDDRMVTDVQFFKNKIDRIDGSGDLGDYLLSVINSKPIVAGPAAETASSEKEGEAA